MSVTAITANVFLFVDTCNVYVIRSGHEAVLIDFGGGAVLNELAAIGVGRITDVLMTHHHRDQGQGLQQVVEAGARVWAPETERHLFEDVEAYWQARPIYNNYDVRQDRFSLLEGVSVAGTLSDYRTYPFGDHVFSVIPTPGHTIGSISLLVQVDERRLAFTGDLIAAPGKLWSLAATQWTYNGAEGVPATILSLLDLKDRTPAMLLPSHGQPMTDPAAAIIPLVERLLELLAARRSNPRLMALREHPYAPITPHLLQNQTSVANSYVVLSESGKALLIDFGYDFVTGSFPVTERAARRPWLYTLPMLKRDYGVTHIDVALPTHYHDDHVAGLNLLREVEGAQVWAAENFAPILRCPAHYDLPCLWYDPIEVDRVLPLGEPIRWEEYTFTLYPLPGHTLYAVAIAFEVDGKRVLATGDQYQGSTGDEYNYVYQNRFHSSDYQRSAELYRQLHPDLIITGHWQPLWVQPDYFDNLQARGELLERLHRDLLPPERLDLTTTPNTADADSTLAWIQPYQSTLQAGDSATFNLTLQNPLEQDANARVRLVLPKGWRAEPPELSVHLPAHNSDILAFEVVTPGGVRVRRARIAADVTIGEQRFGQQAEALVTVK